MRSLYLYNHDAFRTYFAIELTFPRYAAEAYHHTWGGCKGPESGPLKILGRAGAHGARLDIAIRGLTTYIDLLARRI